MVSIPNGPSCSARPLNLARRAPNSKLYDRNPLAYCPFAGRVRCPPHEGSGETCLPGGVRGWPRGRMQNAEVKMQNGGLTGRSLSQGRAGSIGRIGRIGRIGPVGTSVREQRQSPGGVVPHTARHARGVRGDASPRRGLRLAPSSGAGCGCGGASHRSNRSDRSNRTSGIWCASDGSRLAEWYSTPQSTYGDSGSHLAGQSVLDA